MKGIHKIQYPTFHVDIEFSGTKYQPAKVWGPPEDCYPEEGGEVEDATIYLVNGDVKFELTSDMILQFDLETTVEGWMEKVAEELRE